MPRASQGNLHAALPFPPRVQVQGQGLGRLLMSHSWLLRTGHVCHRTLHHICPSSVAKPPCVSGTPSRPDSVSCQLKRWWFFSRLGLLKIYMVMLKGQKSRTCLVVQWLRLRAPNAGNPGLIPGQGTRVHLQQLKILHATIKTNCSQINR